MAALETIGRVLVAVPATLVESAARLPFVVLLDLLDSTATLLLVALACGGGAALLRALAGDRAVEPVRADRREASPEAPRPATDHPPIPVLAPRLAEVQAWWVSRRRAMQAGMERVGGSRLR